MHSPDVGDRKLLDFLEATLAPNYLVGLATYCAGSLVMYALPKREKPNKRLCSMMQLFTFRRALEGTHCVAATAYYCLRAAVF